jgi:PAS domain S-box-containing protein
MSETSRVSIDVAQLALDASRAGTWHWDMATSTVTWDARLEELHGLAPGTFRSTFEHWVELLHPDEVDGVLSDVQNALANPGEYDLLHRATWPDGTVHWIECRGRVTVDDAGTPTGTIGVAFDVTSRKQAEDELRVAREASMTLARRLQASLLGPPVLLPGAGHAARYVPAAHGLNVGGDWYNAQRLPDGRLALAVGDVVGSGLESATIMGQLRSALSAAALGAASAAEGIATLDAFASSVPGAECATAVLALVNVERRTLEYARAGHPPPILVSPSGDVQVLDRGTGMPLGVHPDVSPRQLGEVEFEDGALLVLYSDGLIERRGESIEIGLTRLQASVQRHWQQPLEIICDRLLADMFEDAPQADDVALLVFRTPVSSDRLFLRKVPSEAAALRRVRLALQEWLDLSRVDAKNAAMVQVAIGEACTNAIEHAYADRPGLFRVEASWTDDGLVCCVSDTGRWREQTVNPTRGHGLQIVAALMDEVQVLQHSSGTSVVMRHRCATSPDTRSQDP